MPRELLVPALPLKAAVLVPVFDQFPGVVAPAGTTQYSASSTSQIVLTTLVRLRPIWERRAERRLRPNLRRSRGRRDRLLNPRRIVVDTCSKT